MYFVHIKIVLIFCYFKEIINFTEVALKIVNGLVIFLAIKHRYFSI